MSPLRREAKQLCLLAAPVIVTQLGHMLLGVVDLIMVGRVGVEALDAVSLGHIWVMGTLIVGMGIVFGIDPMVSQSHGAGDPKGLGLALQRGLVLAFLFSIPIALLWTVTEPVLIFLGQDPELAASAHEYAVVQIPGIPTFLMFTALRQYLQGRGIVYPALWIILASNGLNIGLNWSLIFGNLGFPELGVVGAGIATALTRGFLLIALVTWILVGRLHCGGWTGWSRECLDPRGLIRVLRFGTPIGFQLMLEMWAFQTATLLSGHLGHSELAGHTIVLNLASFSFMVPLGVALGAVTRVGNLIGARDPVGAQRAAWVALALGAGLMFISALLFVALRWQLPRVYTNDSSVIALAASILPIAGLFQFFDGIQVVGGGILRGMGRPLPAAIFNLVGYYALALPLSYWLGFHTSLGLAGIWWGLCVGLLLIAGLLIAWIAVKGPRTATPVAAMAA